MTQDKLNIIIVGGGIAGLSAAISTLINGHNAIVLEASKKINEIGAGIQVSSNSTKILKRWGVWEYLKEEANIPLYTDLRDYKTNEVFSVADHTAMSKMYGGPFGNFHRATLHRCLLKKAKDLGVTFLTDARVEGINFDKPSVTLQNGKEIRGDLIVGADGYRSKCMELFRGSEDKPQFSGDMAYRILLDIDDVKDDPILKTIVTDNNIHYWMGPDSHIVSYACDNNKYFNVVILTTCDIEPDMKCSSVHADIKAVQEKFQNWNPIVRSILEKTKEASKWPLWMREGISKWSHENGKFTMLGDSVHVTVPYIGQGAGMGIEDGCVFGESIGKIHSKNDLMFALAVYNDVRIKRCSNIVKMSRDMGIIMHLKDGPAAASRNELMKMAPPLKGDLNLWRDPINAKWLFGFDAFEATKMAFKKVLKLHGLN
ncbi:uncharacterized protein PRCAT00002472001 [Priceomyces carsonii]|uniref:uncharacterized protein n=1 Tax=Priceomyces carsonii TaxID=28549 RepID=UPI002EDB505B|nr:unnamed protein product [Priceomyces carsonii]